MVKRVTYCKWSSSPMKNKLNEGSVRGKPVQGGNEEKFSDWKGMLECYKYTPVME